MKRNLYLSLLCLFNLVASDLPLTQNVKSKHSLLKNILITGAAGFIGSNFLRYMFDKYPNYNFLILDCLTYAGDLDNIPDYIKLSNRFKFFYGSITNRDLVDALMKQVHFVVHFAAESHVTRSIYDDSIFFETDVIGTRVMMNSLVRHKNIERYIHISTSEVFGTAEQENMTEEHPLNPRTPYAAAKAGADRLVYAYWCTFDLPVVLVRPFNNYGPNQHTEKVIPRFITDAIKGESLTIHGTGNQKRDWVHTKDIARALDKILHKKNFLSIKNQVFNLGSGRPISILEIAKVILKHFNLPETHLRFIGDRPGQVALHVSATEKTKKLLNWEPKIKFEEGLEEVIKWYKENETWWKKREIMKLVPIFTDNRIELQ